MKRILVTGATGFIGGQLARYLSAYGHHVRALVRRDSPQLAESGVKLVRGDVTDRDSVRAAVYGVDVVFHLAAARDVWGLPESVYQQVNVTGIQHLLDAAVEASVQRFIYCSSVGVARYPGNLIADETLSFSTPTSQVFYHRSKAQAEQMTLEYARMGRLLTLVVRPVITYGPGDEWGMVTRLVTMLAQGRFIPIGDGRNHVDLVYIDDLVTGMYYTLEKGVMGRVYILSGTSPVQVRALIDKTCALLGRPSPRLRIPVPVAHAAGRGMEALYRLGGRLGLGLDERQPLITRDKVATLTVDRGFSHARASQELGYDPQVGYDEGLRYTLTWLLEREE